MSDNLSYPIAANTLVETKQQPDGSHRAAHRAPETDALLSQLLTAVALLATHADEVSLLAKAEQMRALLAAPALATGAATEATLLAIKTALLAQVELANLIVTDGTSFYVRRETVNEGTGAVAVTFTTLAGAAASPNTGALTPVTGSGGGSGSTRTVETALFDVTTAGTGTSVGDIVARVLVYDTAANSIVASLWHNMTTGATLASAPSAGAIVAQPRNLAVGAAKDSSLLAILAALPASLGAKLMSASLSMAPATDAVFPAPADQDPVFDHANGKKVAVTASVAVITPPAGCKYVRISCDADVVVNAAGQPAVDDGTAVRIVANAPEVVPVTAGVAVYALSLSGASAVVRVTPMKVRS